MVSERLCFEILKFLRGKTTTYTEKAGDGSVSRTSKESDSASEGELYRFFLTRYPLTEIDAAMRWLSLGIYVGKTYPGGLLGGIYVHSLTDKGRKAAEVGGFDKAEKKLFYQEEDPYEVFIAHQFNEDDQSLVRYIDQRVLTPIGFKKIDGRAEGLEDFRSAILTKIKRARFFLCLITKRQALSSGRYASSVWLYQETGAAVAYGKKPLLLVEDGVDLDYIGDLQSIYEYIRFNRNNHPEVFDSIGRRLIADLEAHHIPLPREEGIQERPG